MIALISFCIAHSLDIVCRIAERKTHIERERGRNRNRDRDRDRFNLQHYVHIVLNVRHMHKHNSIAFVFVITCQSPKLVLTLCKCNIMFHCVISIVLVPVFCINNSSFSLPSFFAQIQISLTILTVFYAPNSYTSINYAGYKIHAVLTRRIHTHTRTSKDGVAQCICMVQSGLLQWWVWVDKLHIFFMKLKLISCSR